MSSDSASSRKSRKSSPSSTNERRTNIADHVTLPYLSEDGVYPLDHLDRQILTALLRDARTPFLEISRQLGVSGGTIHQRVDKLREAGVIEGSTLTINHERVGLGITALLGVHIHAARLIGEVIEGLESLPEVVEAYYTTGSYALILKIRVAHMRDYHRFLTQGLQLLDGIRFTESFICLDQPINRPAQLNTPQSPK